MTAPAAQAEPERIHRPARFTRWRPRKWELAYEQIVALSTLGKSNVEIAKLFGYTPQHISNILCTPEASLARRMMLEKLREGVAAKLPQRLDDLADKATQRLAEVLYNDDLASRSPFAVADRGLAVLKGLGKLKDEKEAGKGVNNTFVLTAEFAKQLTDGLAATRRAHELNPPEPVETSAKVVNE